MPESHQRLLHPLLLDRKYWEARLHALDVRPPSLVLTPRPELSDAWIAVDEFRIRTHDDARLFGLRGQSRLNLSPRHARIRVVGPCELPKIDRDRVVEGMTEFVLQQQAGRRLEDRVLDVLRLCQVAAVSEGPEKNSVTFERTGNDDLPDELRIATHLRGGAYPI